MSIFTGPQNPKYKILTVRCFPREGPQPKFMSYSTPEISGYRFAAQILNMSEKPRWNTGEKRLEWKADEHFMAGRHRNQLHTFSLMSEGGKDRRVVKQKECVLKQGGLLGETKMGRKEAVPRYGRGEDAGRHKERCPHMETHISAKINEKISRLGITITSTSKGGGRQTCSSQRLQTSPKS